MIVLALDSSGSSCSVAVVEEERVLAHRFRAMSRGQAEALMPMLRETMEEAAVDFAGLGLIAVTIGPGSFTGIRIGLAAARGLALASGVPAVGVTAFAAIAAAVPVDGTLVVAIDSRRADLFVQIFVDGVATALPAAVAPGDLAALLPEGPLTIAGDGATSAAAALSGRSVSVSDAVALDARAVARVALAQPGDGGALRPLYLRAPDVTLPR